MSRVIEKNVLHEKCKCGNSRLKYCCGFHGLTKTAVSCSDLWPFRCLPWTFTVMYTQRNVIKYQNTHVGTLFHCINWSRECRKYVPIQETRTVITCANCVCTAICDAKICIPKLYTNETSTNSLSTISIFSNLK